MHVQKDIFNMFYASSKRNRKKRALFKDQTKNGLKN